ncbi:MAG: hypothetical protein WBG11_13175 [Methylocella sp.]
MPKTILEIIEECLAQDDWDSPAELLQWLFGELHENRWLLVHESNIKWPPPKTRLIKIMEDVPRLDS